MMKRRQNKHTFADVMMNEGTTSLLKKLASRYEKADFLNNDPAQFMHRYTSDRDVEVVALFAASLALGRRPAILQKMNLLCSWMGEEPCSWIEQRRYEACFPESDEKFYRFYSYRHLRHFCQAVAGVLLRHGSLGRYVKEKYGSGVAPLQALVDIFRDSDIGHLVPSDTRSCCKRLNMFLRWMVRDDSPVDMGLWTWYDKRLLLLPTDTHVMQEALRLGIINHAGSSMSKALEITEAMRAIWPDDPCRGDFALFGWGINGQEDVKSYQ
jgi:uncharacterized protein (TIGR02757 family)